MGLVFLNMAWMEKYEGITRKDVPEGGGAYVEKNGRAEEVCNFLPVNGYCYGRVTPVGDQIHIERLGASEGSESVSHIDVVWTAKRPGGGTVIVGWYRNATVFRWFQSFKNIPRKHRKNGISQYNVIAKKSDVRLLPVDARTIRIPRAQKGGMGESNVWYAESAEAKETIRKVHSLFRYGKVPISRKKKDKKQHNPEHNARVEERAVNLVWKDFEEKGYTLKSVEKENKGWDLEATAAGVTLRIEVKGLSGAGAQVGLTPKEFKAFDRHDVRYRLAIVTEALSKPSLVICRFNSEIGDWVVDGTSKGSLRCDIFKAAIIKID